MSIRTALAWSFSQQFVQYGLNFLASIAIARLLTPAEMGVYALAVGASLLLGSLRDFGIASYLVRAERLDAPRIRTAYGIWIAIFWTLGAILLLAREPLAALYDAPGIAAVLLVVSINYFVTPFGQPANALMRREMRFRELHHIGLACTVAALGTNIGLALAGLSYMALAWGLVAGTVLRAVLLLCVRPDHIRMRPSLRHWREILRFGGYMTGVSIMGSVHTDGARLVLGGFLGPAAVALYERGCQLPAALRHMLNAPLGAVVTPAFAKGVRGGAPIGPAVVRLVAATTAIAWPAFLTLGLLAQPVVVLLFGETWRVAGEILPLLLVAYAIASSLPHPTHVLVPLGRVRALFRLTCFGAASSLIFAAAGAAHGLAAFAWLQPVHAALFYGAAFLCMRRCWQADPAALLVNYARAAVLAASSAIPAAFAVAAFGTAVPLPALAGVAVSAAAIWLAGVFLLRHPVAEELLSLRATLRLRRSAGAV